MTEKRFTQKDEDDWEILDRNKHFAYAHSGYQAEKIIQELNELVETNRELYKENKKLNELCVQYGFEMGKLTEENEQLQQYICDNLGEDICDVCSYQYLEKSDEYYVAKCKKGYDNCSKGTVIHCKDFKFKELME